MSTSEFFASGTRIHRAARRIELSQQRASARSEKIADAAERDALRAQVKELRAALQGMVNAFAPRAEQTVVREGAQALQSDVRKALQALGCILSDEQARAALERTADR